MSKCKNKVGQFVPKGYGYKEIFLPCGSTGIHGERLMCDSCEKELNEQYPQGWRNTPGDICEHGVYVGDYCGPDYICAKCEE